MKRLNFSTLLLLLLIVLPIGSFAQDDIVDEGFSPIYINAPIEDLSENLTETKATNLWFDNVEDPYSQERYVYNVESLKSKLFFGLNVERIEIKASWCYDESSDDDESSEFRGVREFYLFIKLPSVEEFDTFAAEVEDKYGPIRSYEINMEDESETPLWFSFMTMLTFTNYNAPFVAEDGKKYLLVKYRCGHGG